MRLSIRSLLSFLAALIVVAFFLLPSHPVSAVTINATSTAITGDASVVSTLTVSGTKSFLIDHPLDPKNKLLYHYNLESPDVKNIYDGIVTLDESGEAQIEFPDYFLALNKDFRYLATPIGQPMPDLHLSSEVRKKYFGLFGVAVVKFAGGVPGGRVSWQVTGIRHDPYIVAHPLIPEVEKGPGQIVKKGEYLLPEYYKK